MSYNGNGGGGYHGGKGHGGGYQDRGPQEPKPEIEITESTYVDDADTVIAYLKRTARNNRLITTSQLRNIMSMAADIYNQLLTSEAAGDELDDDMAQRIDYLRVKCVYAAGRDDQVRNFLEVSKLIEQIRKVKRSRKSFMLFYRYMEALVAYARFYGGSDS